MTSKHTPTFTFIHNPSAPCSCHIQIHRVAGRASETTFDYQIVYCPLHKAVPALLEALQFARNCFGQYDGAHPEGVTIPWAVAEAADAAIAQALGEEVKA